MIEHIPYTDEEMRYTPQKVTATPLLSIQFNPNQLYQERYVTAKPPIELDYFPAGFDAIPTRVSYHVVVRNNSYTDVVRQFANQVFTWLGEPVRSLDIAENSDVTQAARGFMEEAQLLLLHTLPARQNLCAFAMSMRVQGATDYVCGQFCKMHREKLGVADDNGARFLLPPAKLAQGLVEHSVGVPACSCDFCESRRKPVKMSEQQFVDAYTKLVDSTARKLFNIADSINV